MKINNDLRFVLDNMINSWQCRTCDTLWIHFDHTGQNGFFRLCDNPNELCKQCIKIDDIVTSQSLMTTERWQNE